MLQDFIQAVHAALGPDVDRKQVVLTGMAPIFLIAFAVEWRVLRHRAHHGRNPQYIDRNDGGVLILFDRWFGTYVEEDEPVDCGIPRQVRSNNLWTLNVHEFVDMWRDMLRPGPLWLRLKHLWAPPEWLRPVVSD